MTELQFEKHQKLLSVKEIEKRIRNLNEQIYMLTESEYSPQVQQLKSNSTGGSGTTEKDLSDYIVKLEQLNTKLVREKSALVRKRCEILDAISKLHENEAAIIEELYILQWSVTKISRENNYSPRQIFRIRNKALDNIEI